MIYMYLIKNYFDNCSCMRAELTKDYDFYYGKDNGQKRDVWAIGTPFYGNLALGGEDPGSLHTSSLGGIITCKKI